MEELKERIAAVHKSLGIPKEYENGCGLILQFEASDLAEIENDIYGRPQRLRPEAASAWRAMKGHAENEGIVLNIVSAFRTVDRQSEIIQRKIDSGQTISEILRVCAAPGYSEHHTGRAVDLTTKGCEPLSVSFDTTEAFRWLKDKAHYYSFKLSYPNGNKLGISYEPWHWAYNPEAT
jgi:D-alanyl-D-alanine carboxypeptidase